MSGYARNARLSRAAMLVVAGGALVGVVQRAGLADLAAGQKLVLAGAGVLMVVGLIAAVRALTDRSGRG